MRVLLATAAVTLGLALGAAPTVAVEVVANFEGGGSTAAPVTDVVDAYYGMGGGGWSDAWNDYHNTSGIDFSVATADANPLGAGKYLDVTGDATAASRGGSVSRSFTAGIDTAASHSIEFKYRVNETFGDASTFTNSNDRYQLFDVDTNDRSTANGYCSWIIGCYGGAATWVDQEDCGYWLVYDGDNDDGTPLNTNQVNTGILVQSGAIYDFRVDVDAVTRTWDVTIGSGGTTLYDSRTLIPDGLGWRTARSIVGGRVTFGCYANSADDVRAYSIHGLKITGAGASPPLPPPEPVSAHFTYGNTDQEVDAYVGKAGGGWKTPWMTQVSNATITARAMAPGDFEFNEIKPELATGAYLKVDATPGASLARVAVARNYKVGSDPGICWNQEHTIQFTLRIDEGVDEEFRFLDQDDRYMIFDSSAQQSTTDGACSWIVSAFSKYATENEVFGSEVVKQWSFYNGAKDGGGWDKTRNVDTNIDVTTGGVYDFTIIVDPLTQSYDAIVKDGTNTYDSRTLFPDGLGWRTAATDIGGYLTFVGRSNADDDLRAFSLDEVLITQTLVVPTIPGDTDGNKVVDAEDAAVLAQHWGENVGTLGYEMGDFNGDQIVNAADASILAANWGNHNSESSVGVPEPSAMILAIAGLVLAALVRRR